MRYHWRGPCFCVGTDQDFEVSLAQPERARGGTDQDHEVSLVQAARYLSIHDNYLEEGTVNAVSVRRAAIVEGRSMQDSLSNASACLIVDDIFVNKLLCAGGTDYRRFEPVPNCSRDRSHSSEDCDLHVQ